jgi:Na+-transporting NADH:ubiquinone oxidoreductase subunit NqrD
MDCIFRLFDTRGNIVHTMRTTLSLVNGVSDLIHVLRDQFPRAVRVTVDLAL